MIATPLLVLGLCELVLRLAGYGFPTSFLLPGTINGRQMLVDNDKFGWRFFPPAIARSPTPIAIEAHKTAGVYRIFLFGESAALGDPKPSLGVAHYLEILLEERIPGARFEVIPAAMTAINSHVMVPIARELAHCQADLWIVYAGNNEFIGPFGPNTVFGTAALPLPAVRFRLALLKTRTGQFLSAITDRMRHGKRGTDWTGLKMFRENQIAPQDPRRAAVGETFRRNLEDVVRAGLGAGVPVVLSTMGSNLRDCAPFGSLHTPPLSDESLAAWQKAYQTAAAQSEQQAWSEAAAGFREAARQSPQYAEAYFRLAQSEEALSKASEARDDFVRARDLDAMPFRASSRLNAAVQAVARAHASQPVGFVDSEKWLSEASPNQIPGKDLFFEHVHLTPEGNYRLALGLADAVLARLPANLQSRKTAAWADADVCAQKIGLTDWNRHGMLEEIARRLADAPYTSQFNNLAQRKELFDEIASVREKMHPRNVMDAKAGFKDALKERPDRAWLHQNYAEFLELAGEIDQAAAEWKTVQQMLPHHHVAYFQAGRLLARARRYDEARTALETAIRIRPDLEEAHLELGQVYFGQRKWDEALAEYALAQRYRPDDPRVLVRRADVYAVQSRRDDALQSLRDAIRMRPSYWEARYLLGVELAMDGNLAEAQSQFEEVIRQKPDHAAARFNLGVALAKQQHMPEAIRQFEETLKLNPDHKQARQYLDALQSSGRTNR